MTTIVSAPGKVLIAGGYLVLDPAYSGVVVATSARFYCLVQSVKGTGNVTVHSPQFNNGTWKFDVNLTIDGVVIDPHPHDEKNSYIHITLQNTLNFLYQLQRPIDSSLRIVIVGDNDFYSQAHHLKSRGLPLTSSSLRTLPSFIPANDTITNVHKTGLGSSAALITSLVASLLVHYDAITIQELSVIHNVAQFCHCLAQGKIGSGFDVSSAVYGSHLYTRFNPEVLTPLMETTGSSYQLTKVLKPSEAWTQKVVPFELPPGLELSLADINAGSATPGMVSKVLKWRKDNPKDAGELWERLQSQNMKLYELFTQLGQYARSNPDEYQEILQKCAQTESSTWNTKSRLLFELHVTFQNIRKLLRRMSELAQVSIEPPSQTVLLDKTIAIPGVLMAGVPGAGGYDAIFIITLSKEARSRVEEMLLNSGENICLLCCQQSNAGVRTESLDVTSLKHILNMLNEDMSQ